MSRPHRHPISGGSGRPFCVERDRVLNHGFVQQLLATLEQSHLHAEASALRRAFEVRGWHSLTPEDLNQVVALVARAQGTPRAESAPAAALAQTVAVADAPGALFPPATQAWSPLEAYAAWVDAVPRGRDMLALLDALARSDSWAEAVALVRTLFVTHLRYEAHEVDESGRITDNQTLRRVRTVARQDAFVVSMVELSFPYSYPSTFQPLFRLHPYGLVVAVAPGWNASQFAFRVGQAAETVTRVRALTGRLHGEQLHDTLVVWLRRMDLLRARGGENAAALQERAAGALGASAAELCRAWLGVPLDASAPPPGPDWAALPAHERRAFLQDGAGAVRHAWGLERALRSIFPVGLCGKQAMLRYAGYDVGSEVRPAEEALQAGTSWVRRVTLRMEVVRPGLPPDPVTLIASVPEVDAEGRLLLDGTWYRFVPEVLAEGRLLDGAEDEAPDPEHEAAEEVEALDGLDLDGEEDAAAQGSDTDDDALLEETADLDAAPAGNATLPPIGAGLCALLEQAALRKLHSVAKRLISFAAEPEHVAAQVPGLLRPLHGRDEALLLVAKHYLKRQLRHVRATSLEPVERLPVLRQRDGTDGRHPPAWACPDVSAHLPVGAWLPVAAARLAPGGELAVPTREAGELPRLSVSRRHAWEVNPRAGAPDVGVAGWWVAPQLATYAHLPAGSIGAAAWAAVHGVPLDVGARVLRVPGERLMARALARPPAPSEPLLLQVRLPTTLAPQGSAPYRVLVEKGARVAPGQRWLSAPLWLWGRGTTAGRGNLKTTPTWHFVQETYLPETDANEVRLAPDTATHTWSVPPGWGGRVADVTVTDELHRSGEPVGLRITLRVVPDAPGPDASHVLLPDGRIAPVGAPLPAEDAPFCEAGAPADWLVEDPALLPQDATGECWFDGASGELLPQSARLGGPAFRLLPARPALVGPDYALRFRARDGAGIPATPASPALSAAERTWWAAAQPRDAERVAQVERAWAGGLPPYWSHLVEVLEAAGVRAPLLPGEEVLGALRAPVHPKSRLDLTSTRLKHGAAGYLDEDEAPLGWTCRCGRVTGRQRAFELCAPPQQGGCGTPALLTPRLHARRKLRRLKLPEAVLHPWRMEAAAAALGLTRAELEARFARFGAAGLALRLSRALREADVTAPARERLARLQGAERAELARALAHLEEVRSAGRPMTRDFFLSRLAVLPRALHPTGLPVGSPGAVQAPLTRAYLQVVHASELLETMRGRGTRLMVRTARTRLQEAMCGLFGPASQREVGADGCTSLAALLVRLWPLTRAPGLRSVVPGTFAIAGAPGVADARPVRRFTFDAEGFLLPTAAADWALANFTDAPPLPPIDDDEEDDADEAVAAPEADATSRVTVVVSAASASPGAATPGVVTPHGPVWLPTPPAYVPRPADPSFWGERAARARLLCEHLPALMAVVGAFGSSARHEATRWPWHHHLKAQLEEALSAEALENVERKSMESLLVAALAEACSREESRPLALCEALESARPHSLEADGEGALRWALDLTMSAFPGEAPPVRVARALLSRALCGWWVGGKKGGGWTWLPPQMSGPAGARRMAPGLRAGAWDAWPGMLAISAPVRFLLHNARRDVLDACGRPLGLALGLPGTQVPEGAWDALRAAPPAAAVSHEEPSSLSGPAAPIEAPQAAPFVAALEAAANAVAADAPDAAPEAGGDSVALLSTSILSWLGPTAALPAPLAPSVEAPARAPAPSPPAAPSDAPAEAPGLATSATVLLSTSITSWLKR